MRVSTTCNYFYFRCEGEGKISRTWHFWYLSLAIRILSLPTPHQLGRSSAIYQSLGIKDVSPLDTSNLLVIAFVSCIAAVVAALVVYFRFHLSLSSLSLRWLWWGRLYCCVSVWQCSPYSPLHGLISYPDLTILIVADYHSSSYCGYCSSFWHCPLYFPLRSYLPSVTLQWLFRGWLITKRELYIIYEVVIHLAGAFIGCSEWYCCGFAEKISKAVCKIH